LGRDRFRFPPLYGPSGTTFCRCAGAAVFLHRVPIEGILSPSRALSVLPPCYLVGRGFYRFARGFLFFLCQETNPSRSFASIVFYRLDPKQVPSSLRWSLPTSLSLGHVLPPLYRAVKLLSLRVFPRPASALPLVPRLCAHVSLLFPRPSEVFPFLAFLPFWVPSVLAVLPNLTRLRPTLLHVFPVPRRGFVSYLPQGSLPVAPHPYFFRHHM